MHQNLHRDVEPVREAERHQTREDVDRDVGVVPREIGPRQIGHDHHVIGGHDLGGAVERPAEEDSGRSRRRVTCSIIRKPAISAIQRKIWIGHSSHSSRRSITRAVLLVTVTLGCRAKQRPRMATAGGHRPCIDDGLPACARRRASDDGVGSELVDVDLGEDFACSSTSVNLSMSRPIAARELAPLLDVLLIGVDDRARILQAEALAGLDIAGALRPSCIRWRSCRNRHRA